ncbi:oxidoreductase, partial [Streptomyces oryzae]|nr:oxidoreductase [Streptomyces oryzae]
SLPHRVARAGGELAGLLAPHARTAPSRESEPEVIPFEQQLAALRVEK